jgi:hypothetical protein
MLEHGMAYLFAWHTSLHPTEVLVKPFILQICAQFSEVSFMWSYPLVLLLPVNCSLPFT